MKKPYKKTAANGPAHLTRAARQLAGRYGRYPVHRMVSLSGRRPEGLKHGAPYFALAGRKVTVGIGRMIP
jgi:hypothetical protein